jgi:hypothetical protein
LKTKKTGGKILEKESKRSDREGSETREGRKE